ncbi:MAG: EAL domain-containing protein, partial [Actinomycetota bacterium]|nr:EAL domain-containing protein [Actinomycetota bacterium]
MRQETTPVTMFVGGVILAASAALFALVRAGPVSFIENRWLELAIFAFLVCVCEVKPVTVARAGGIQEVVASATFSFAIFLTFGPLPAIAAQAIASLIGDIAGKKHALKTAFNIAQYVLAWALPGLLFQAIMGGRTLRTEFTWRWAAALVVSGAAYFLCNTALVGMIIALTTRSSLWRGVTGMVTREASSDVVLLALSPIVIVAAERSLVLLPVLLLPVLAVYRSALLSAEKEHQAMHDALTDLPNRLQFSEVIERRFENARSKSTRGAVLLIDLDRFKEVNDTLGHQTGDALLCQIGPRIQPVLPEGGVIARLGGDEFAVMVPDIGADNALRIGEAIVEVLEPPFRLDEFNLEVQASIGIALFPDHGASADALIKQADIAMYFAKGRNSGIEIYNAEHDQNSRRRLSLLSDLRTALVNGDVVVHYQPKLDLSTSTVTSVEALVRWHHPLFGMIPPAEFVPFAEHTGLIRPLTNFVLRTAVTQARAWLDAGLDTAVAVNLSARSLHDGAISDEIARLLSEFSLPAHRVQLEITESSIMADPARAKRVLDDLDAMGLHLSIDDFGTGYSSLSYLQDLPVREVKIDMSFVTNVLENPRDRVIVRSTIDLARHLGLRSTAEGIESAAAQEWLRLAGCDQGQGLHIAPPMPADEATAWLTDATRIVSLSTGERFSAPGTVPRSRVIEAGIRGVLDEVPL